MSHESWVTGHGSRVTGHESRVKKAAFKRAWEEEA